MAETKEESPSKESSDASTPAVDNPDLIRAPLRGEVSRRGFLSTLSIAWVAFTGASLGILGATGRFLFPNVLFEPPQEFKAGFPDDFAVDKVDERFKASYGCWIIRESSGFYVLSTVCTHLGCTPNWLSADEKFKCPCHGSGFYMSGIHFEGPAPRPLERHRIALAGDGQLLVDRSRIFQQEKGQWYDPESFLKYTG